MILFLVMRFGCQLFYKEQNCPALQSLGLAEDFLSKCFSHLSLLVDNAPPAETSQQPAADVLHHPEVDREEESDKDEGGDEGVEGEQVQQERDHLESDMEDHHAAVGRSSLPLTDHPGKFLSEFERGRHLFGGKVKPDCSSGSWVASGLYSLLAIFLPLKLFCLSSSFASQDFQHLKLSCLSRSLPLKISCTSKFLASQALLPLLNTYCLLLLYQKFTCG